MLYPRTCTCTRIVPILISVLVHHRLALVSPWSAGSQPDHGICIDHHSFQSWMSWYLEYAYLWIIWNDFAKFCAWVFVLLKAFFFSLLSIIWYKFILFIDCLIELFCFCKFIALSYLNRGICQREKGRNCRCGLKSCLTENPLPGLWFHYLITALVQLLEGLLPPAALLLLVYLAQVPMRVCLSLVQRSH